MGIVHMLSEKFLRLCFYQYTIVIFILISVFQLRTTGFVQYSLYLLSHQCVFELRAQVKY